ncbi:transglutaminase-like cysteine peptidase [Arcobacteraceae bacterium]|nr:transglutaminase-like cysteine peptidase [Arcobacteraceae bacterium]
MFYNIFVLSLILSLNAHALWDEKEMNYYKNKYMNDITFKVPKEVNNVFFVSEETKKLFTRRYGNNALKRLNYIDKTIQDLADAPLHKKLVTINKLVNRLNFMTDIKQWGRKNYWATPLEVIGTNHGDTEDLSLLKYVLMVKVGIDPNDIQLIKKDIPFIGKKEKHKENIGLFFFTKKHINPFVIDYQFKKGKIYKYKDQFKFEYIKLSQNKQWDVLFKKNLTSNDVDGVTNFIAEKDTLKTVREIDVFY